MNIEDVKIYPFTTKRIYKTNTADLGGKAKDEDGVIDSYFYLIELITKDGIRGYGEISDVPATMKLPGSHAVTTESLSEFIKKLLVNQNPYNHDEILRPFPIAELTDTRNDGTVYDIVRCGIESALYDLIGKMVNLPVYRLIGGKKRNEIPVSWVVFIRELEALEEEIQEKVNEGFTSFKLKVGINPDEDEERLRMIRKIAGDTAHIKLDANSGWTFDEAVEQLKRLEKYNPAGIETPIAYLDIAGKAKLKEKISIPIIEHVHDLAFGIELIKNNAVDVFNVSTVGAGGISKAKMILSLAEEQGIPSLLGSTVEAGVGTAAQLHLGVTSEAITWPSDLVGPKLYVDDYIHPGFEWNGDKIIVPDGIGLGVEPTIAKLNNYA